MKKYLWIICLSSVSLINCSSGNDQEILDIQSYITDTKLPFVDTLGIYVYVNNRGIDTIKDKSLLFMNYTGKYLDDTVFEHANDTIPKYVLVNGLIKGLKNGLKLFGRDGKGTIIIPSDAGFGANPPRGIKNNATLIYDITIKDFY